MASRLPLQTPTSAPTHYPPPCAVPVVNGVAVGLSVDTGRMRVYAVLKTGNAAAYNGSWLDTNIQVYKSLPMPVTGLLGELAGGTGTCAPQRGLLPHLRACRLPPPCKC